MADAARRRATYQDVLDAPEHLIAEIIDGELVTQPRPAGRHSAVASAIGEELGPPFKRGRGGPGGWLILYEPELHLGDHVLVPDLAGWRRARLPHAISGSRWAARPWRPRDPVETNQESSRRGRDSNPR